jgi:hypothetical protein
MYHIESKLLNVEFDAFENRLKLTKRRLKCLNKGLKFLTVDFGNGLYFISH